MENKAIEELIKKRKHNHIDCGQERGILIEDFIADLKTLQPERDEVEIKGYDYWMDEGQCTLGDCVCGYKQLRIDSKYCSGCGAKIKRIE